MAIHSFDSAIAQQVGVNAAIIYQNIQFWVEKNQANNKHFYDGCYWTYNSVKAFSQLFPYFTERQIRTAIDKLKEVGLIKVGNFNKSNYDRTTWYSCNFDLTSMSNEFDQNDEPIPYSKPVNKTDNNYPAGLTSDLLASISEIWNNTMTTQPSVDLTKQSQINKKRWAKIKKITKDHPNYLDHEYWEGYINGLASHPDLQWQRENRQLTFDQAVQLDKFERNRDYMLMERER